MNLTFTQYLITLHEDTSAEVTQLQQEISAVDARIAQQINPLNRRKQQLTTMLARKQEQLAAEQKQSGGNQQQPQQQSPMQASQTTTPGSAGAQTPGSSTA